MWHDINKVQSLVVYNTFRNTFTHGKAMCVKDIVVVLPNTIFKPLILAIVFFWNIETAKTVTKYQCWIDRAVISQ